ncbi:SHOCT domain-containing protein [Planosporangium mesophilum]|uniref:Membrane protein n=1 Tax=Planosporangium mesophilum TaxID=689768 RepID=A0A8J3TK45_9ACTN|nr:SHOCT domain-containing protein [Planosporangium mesophilum]NJC84137.1 SHOCT domain-containing protein [Planosporangium mesophilum]GII22860.1 membrane protein [Planosporangium mesophilum]
MSAYPLLNVFLTMLWFFLWVLWIFLVCSVIFDIFRSRDLGGWAKAGWTIFVIVLPLLGVLSYLVARGDKMYARQARDVQARDEQARAFIKDAAGAGTADELAKLVELKQRGAISEAEFERGKTKVLAA